MSSACYSSSIATNTFLFVDVMGYLADISRHAM